MAKKKKFAGFPFIFAVFFGLTFIFTLLITTGFWFLSHKNALYSLTLNNFNGKIYEVSFPSNWKFEGPSEGPITGFPEFSKIVSPSGDTQIFIGLRGDNRFEFTDEDLQTNTEPLYIEMNGNKYYAEENFLDLNKDGEYDIATVEVELNDANFIGYREYSQEIFLPIKIQILYGFSSEKVPFAKKLETYNLEKQAAIDIIKTFKLKKK